MRSLTLFSVLIVAASWFFNVALSRAVFGHYMVGTVTEDDAHKDIDDAIAMGLDGFALNVGNPYEPFVGQTLGYLFGYAAYRGFNLYLSMDLYASGDACYKGGASCNNISDYTTILTDYLGSSAWYKGPNGQPMISTFSSGGCTNATMQAWKQYFAFDMFFIPMLDETAGYYESAPEWWDYWGGVCDGIFSWESSWPDVGGTNEGDVSKDQKVMNGALAHGKPYMIGLSMLQYKNSYGTNLYRRGELNLPIRMANILNMSPLPDFVQILTWNDGPEGHYIGNLWTEQNNDTQPFRYASQVGADHTGIQPLLTSFINAYKAGGSAGSMSPGSNVPAVFENYTPVVGAMWYKTILQSTTCADDGLGQYFNKPNGSSAGVDALNWAVVLPSGASGTISLISNGATIGTYNAVPGLNYGSAQPVSPGAQVMKVENSYGTLYYTSLGRCVSSDCVDDIYNFNPQIVPLDSTAPPAAGCWQTSGTATPIQDPKSGIFYAVDGESYGPLNVDSSCVDLEGIGPLSPDGVLSQGLWAPVDIDNKFKSWFSQRTQGGTNSWLLDLTNPLGIGQSTGICTIKSPCKRPDCNSLNKQGTEAGSGWRYEVVISAVNLNNFLESLYSGAVQGGINFALTQVALASTFWPSGTDGNGIFGQILNALSVAIAVLAVIAGPEFLAVAVFAELIKGVINGVILTLSPLDQQLQNLAAMESFASNFLNATEDEFTAANDQLLVNGTFSAKGADGNYNTVSITDVFAGGGWVDYRKIPVLTAGTKYDAPYLGKYAYNHLMAGLINFAWKEQNVYIVRFPMTQDEFDNNYSNAGTNDSRLKYYYKGYGHFFQSSVKYTIGLNDYSLVTNPPGWGDLSNGSYPFTTWDIIKSSSDSFDIGGFKYVPSIDEIGKILDKTYSIDETSYSLPGVFTLPICEPSTQYISVNDLFSYLNPPNSRTGLPVFCHCYGQPDMNNHTIDEVINITEFLLSYCGTEPPISGPTG